MANQKVIMIVVIIIVVIAITAVLIYLLSNIWVVLGLFLLLFLIWSKIQ
jgi:hypothetical protein